MNLLIEEDRYTGNISRKIIKSFFTMFCGYLSFLIIAILSGAQIYFQSISIGELSKEDDDDDKDKNAYIENYMEKEGIELSKDNMKANPGTRNVMKLMLNRQLAKF